ncbi:glutaredoxin domain-containing protein [Actinoplanes sp. NPDC049548]|uniref:glutaredoxin domain-containing protein n=1 Tax=Actinoplanes sp. NPDC049548 TaxID=3155152 RepID=UPI00342E2018
MLRRWLPAGMLVAVGIALAYAAGPLALIVPVALAAALSPLAFPRSVPATEARRRSAADGKPIVYWRPGCPYCLRLRATVGLRAHRAHWVDIWRDPDGAAAVRAVAAGNETVPTVILAGEPLVNPDPRRIRAAL